MAQVYKVYPCRYCKLPYRGGITGNKYCVCDDKKTIARILKVIKDRCASCGMLMNDVDPLARHFMRGNYCERCAAIKSY